MFTAGPRVFCGFCVPLGPLISDDEGRLLSDVVTAYNCLVFDYSFSDIKRCPGGNTAYYRSTPLPEAYF